MAYESIWDDPEYDPVKYYFQKFCEQASEIHEKAGNAELVLRPGIHKSPRSYAETAISGDDIVVAVAPEISDLPEAHIEGIMAHEFGHILVELMSRKGDYDSNERLVDLVGEQVFGLPIFYDRLGIETTCDVEGIYDVRPDGLR